jgi:hypothetical protein
MDGKIWIESELGKPLDFGEVLTKLRKYLPLGAPQKIHEA